MHFNEIRQLLLKAGGNVNEAIERARASQLEAQARLNESLESDPFAVSNEIDFEAARQLSRARRRLELVLGELQQAFNDLAPSGDPIAVSTVLLLPAPDPTAAAPAGRVTNAQRLQDYVRAAQRVSGQPVLLKAREVCTTTGISLGSFTYTLKSATQHGLLQRHADGRYSAA